MRFGNVSSGRNGHVMVEAALAAPPLVALLAATLSLGGAALQRERFESALDLAARAALSHLTDGQVGTAAAAARDALRIALFGATGQHPRLIPAATAATTVSVRLCRETTGWSLTAEWHPDIGGRRRGRREIPDVLAGRAYPWTCVLSP